jgi:uncharacterized protein
MKFLLHCRDGASERRFIYDNETSTLTHEDGRRATQKWKCEHEPQPVRRTSRDDPNGKLAQVRVLKIQLGLSCNYSCEYCSQRFVPHGENGVPADADKFVRNLDLWLDGVPTQIEFWGGEPFAYWKTLKPLAELLREKFPQTFFLVITNGSLLTKEINDWLVELDFNVGISHDGPGQFVRGPDPLEDPEQRKHILDLFNRLSPRQKISFNSMLNRKNTDRAAIQEFFRDLLGHGNFSIGEGGFIDPYDEGGVETSLHTHAEALAFRNLALEQIRGLQAEKFIVVGQRMREWSNSIKSERDADVLGQKCGMDRPDTIAVDLKGNVLTCQNTSTSARAPNGESHHIGHVSRLDAVKLKTATHWAHRDDCASCPVLQMCKGSCMFLEGPLWDKACNNSFNDHIPFFAAAIERLTGYLPYRIESATLPPERSLLWSE